MKISNSEDANRYYNIVNSLIDDYIEKWKIKPSSLSKYLKPGSAKFESFIKNNNLQDVDGIKRIVQDVIDDRRHMELDGIMKFEDFIIKESVTEPLIELDKPSIEHEKAIADFFNTSLGHIELLDDENHMYEVSDFGKKFKCVIYSSKELEQIKKKLEDDSYNDFCNKSIKIDPIIGQHQYIKMSVSDIISEEKFRQVYSRELNEKKLIMVVSAIINGNYNKEFKGYHIWTIE